MAASKVSFYITRFVATLSVVIFMTAGSAAAQDLLHYYHVALSKDPQLRGAEFEHLASRETLRQAYGALLPQANAEVTYTMTNQDVTSSENKVYSVGSTSYDTQSYGVNLTLPLFRYPLLLDVSKAKKVLKRSDLELEKSRQDLALRIIEAYMDIQSVQGRLEAVLAEENALALHHERAKERTAKGLAPITDLYDAEARLAAVRAQQVELEFALKDAKQALSEMCDEPVQQTKALKDEIPLQPPVPEGVERWVQDAAEHNPDLQIQRYKAQIADAEVKRQKAGHYPSLDFQADYTMKDTSGSLFGGGSSTTTYDFLVKFTLPIYEGGLRTSRTREAYNMYASAEEGVIKLLRSSERKVRSSYNGVLGAKTRVLAMKKSVEAQQMVVAAKEEGFRSGMLIGLAVLDAMQDLYKYRKEYSQARSDYIVNMARLKHAVGSLGQDDLKQINIMLQD